MASLNTRATFRVDEFRRLRVDCITLREHAHNYIKSDWGRDYNLIN